MFFWFIGTAILTVWFVFRDPFFDYRLLIVGSVLPLADVFSGGAGVLHTLVFSLLLMIIVMLSTVGRRPVRKLWLGLPIGTMLHLVFDGAWATTALFWWPLGGWSFEELEPPGGVPRLADRAVRARRHRDGGVDLAPLAARRTRRPRRAFLHDGRLLT